ncbi:MAG: CBS domain-containing protein [Euryarchaeota archaeon]|nr:CBS domain-containing protein [Euryarchaeota archaeon]
MKAQPLQGTAGSVMVPRDRVVAFLPSDTLLHAATLLQERDYAGAPVLDPQERVVGVLSVADILKCATLGPLPVNPMKALLYMRAKHEDTERVIQRLKETRVETVMSKPAVTIGPDTPLPEAARLMVERGFNRLPIVDPQGKLMGLISRADLLAASHSLRPRA